MKDFFYSTVLGVREDDDDDDDDDDDGGESRYARCD